MRVVASRQGSCFLAQLNGQPMAVGARSIPEWRTGAHSELFCTLASNMRNNPGESAVVVAEPGSASQCRTAGISYRLYAY